MAQKILILCLKAKNHIYLDKIGLGYVEEVNQESSKDSQHKIPACIYYFEMGHSYEKCFSRRKAKQKVKKPKKLTNTKGPKKIWVPKAKDASNAGVS